MTIFLTLLVKILPLYLSIFLGYVAGKRLNVSGQNISNLAIYIIGPIVFFGFVAKADLQLRYFFLPILLFGFCFVISGIGYVLGKYFYGDNTSNLFASMLSMGNSGYFGLPVAIAIFEPRVVGIYVITFLGMTVYQTSMGYYLLAKGKLSGKDSLQKLVRLPAIYGIVLGLIWNMTGLELPPVALNTIDNFKGAFTVIGMMVVGAAIARMTTLKMDWKFLSLSMAVRFVIWPAVIGLFVLLDMMVLGLFNSKIYEIFTLLAVLPLAATSVAYSESLELHPDKTAAAVMLSTLIALAVIPLTYTFVLS